MACPRDEVSLLRIINTPARGIGATTVEKLIQLAVRKGTMIWNILPEAEAEGAVSARTLTALHAFHALLQRYSLQIHQKPQEMAHAIRRLLQEINYESEIARQYKEEAQQESRKNILEEFVNSIAQYAEKDENPSLLGFLETTALMDRDEQSEKDDELSDNSVRLMTLHSAKGLEFPRVYLVGMEEGLLPHKRSIESGLEKDIAEERRLAYVGVTRAMDHLTLSRAKSRMKWGKRRESVCSRFLFEMQPDPGGELPEQHITADSDNSTQPAPAPLASKPPLLSPAARPTVVPTLNEFEAPPF